MAASAARSLAAVPLSHQQFPLLDSLRGFAAIAILAAHAAYFAGMTDADAVGRGLLHLDIGVPFFFLLSAFLLYRPFVAARVRGTPALSFRDYARRRFVRIAPAYWVALTVAALVPGFAGAFSGNWWVYYGLLQNFPVYTPTGGCAVDAFRCGIPTAWSLAIEVAFYIMLPFFVLATGWLTRRRRMRGWLTIELMAVAVLSLVSVVILSFRPDSDPEYWLFFSPFGRGWWFGLGLALASISVAVSERDEEPRVVRQLRARPGVPLLAAVGLYALSCVVVPDSRLAFPLVEPSKFVAQYLLVGVIAALCLLPMVFGQEGGGWSRRVLRNPIPTWLGLISYGIFLWQIPVMTGLIDLGVLEVGDGVGPSAFTVLFVTSFAVTVVVAALSYFLLERPLMRLVRGRGRTRAADLVAEPGRDRPGRQA